LNGVWSQGGGTGTRLSGYVLNGGTNNPVSMTSTVTVFSGAISNHEFVTATSVTQYQVNFAVSGSGSITNPATGNGYYDSGSLAIAASANTGYSFSQWSSTGSITFLSSTSSSTTATISGTGTISAGFAANAVTLTLTPGSGGSIGANPSSGWHYGGVVTVTATPSTGYSFGSWGGALSGSTNPTTITMNGDKTVTAGFKINTYAITVTQGANGLITGPSSADWGTDAVYTIAPSEGYHIVDVVLDGTTHLGSVTSATISTVKEDGHSITASFALTMHSTDLTISVSPNTINKYDGLYATVSGYLKSEGVGLNNYAVTISYNDGRNGWIECKTQPTTDINGHYTIEFPVTPDFANGFVAFQAEFAGDSANGYAPATPALTGSVGTQPGNLNVLPEYVFGGLAAIGACFAAFMLFRKYKSLPHLNSHI